MLPVNHIESWVHLIFLLALASTPFCQLTSANLQPSYKVTSGFTARGASSAGVSSVLLWAFAIVGCFLIFSDCLRSKIVSAVKISAPPRIFRARDALREFAKRVSEFSNLMWKTDVLARCLFVLISSGKGRANASKVGIDCLENGMQSDSLVTLVLPGASRDLHFIFCFRQWPNPWS